MDHDLLLAVFPLLVADFPPVLDGHGRWSWGWSRHARANRALDIIKSYADQGKDPPPELLKGLQGEHGRRLRPRWLALFARTHGCIAAFLFTALAIAFGFLTSGALRR